MDMEALSREIPARRKYVGLQPQYKFPGTTQATHL